MCEMNWCLFHWHFRRKRTKEFGERWLCWIQLRHSASLSFFFLSSAKLRAEIISSWVKRRQDVVLMVLALFFRLIFIGFTCWQAMDDNVCDEGLSDAFIKWQKHNWLTKYSIFWGRVILVHQRLDFRFLLTRVLAQFIGAHLCNWLGSWVNKLILIGNLLLITFTIQVIFRCLFISVFIFIFFWWKLGVGMEGFGWWNSKP